MPFRQLLSVLAATAALGAPAAASAEPFSHVTQPVANGSGGAATTATGITFLGDGQLQAAAEPVRRGGGNAQVVNP